MAYGLRPKRLPRIPKAIVGAGGGVGIAGQGAPPTPTAPYITPPFLSFDPAIEAQRRAAQRGLEDTQEDVATKEHFAEHDLAQALRNIRTQTSRTRGKVNREASRGNREFGNKEEEAKRSAARSGEDLATKSKRGNEDFDTQLANIGRQFAQLGHRQAEGANQAGVLDTGTQNASSVARAGNQRLSEAPINTARGRFNEDISTEQGRLGEDLSTALSRIAQGRTDLGEDSSRSLTQLVQDRNRERKQSRTETGRKLFEGQRELGRATREAKISDVDLLAQEIYAARAEHPTVFKNWKVSHPEAIARAEGKAAQNKAAAGGGGNKKPAPPPTGGTSAPSHKKKKGK